MDVIVISSDSDSDCVVSPQPPLKKQRTTFHRERMKEARDEIPLPQKTKEMAVEVAREDRIADEERQRGEEKYTRGKRRQAARGGREDAVAVASGLAVEGSEQRQETRDVRDEALVHSTHLPFPMTGSAPVVAPVEAVASPAAPSSVLPSPAVPSSVASSSVASPRFRADERAQPLPGLPIAAEKPSLPDTATASAEKPTPSGSDWKPRLKASAVLDSSDPPTQQKSPRQASLDQSRSSPQQHTRRGNTAPALPPPLRAVIAH